MAIVEMSKIKLYGASADKQKVLDTLFESRLVKLKEVGEIENTSSFFDENLSSELDSRISKIDRFLKLLEDNIFTFYISNFDFIVLIYSVGDLFSYSLKTLLK